MLHPRALRRSTHPPHTGSDAGPGSGSGGGVVRRSLAATAGLALVASLVSGVAAHADDEAVPSKREVADARQRAEERARDVAAVQADLVMANEQLREASVAAAQAAEAYNGARWRAEQAQLEVRRSRAAAADARADVNRQQKAYSAAIVRSYEMAPEVTAFSAAMESDGIETLFERSSTMHAAEDALSGRYDQFRASATLAEMATERAEEAESRAERARAEAEQARDAAAAAADAAATQTAQVTATKDQLVAELAELQGISVQLASERQSALEQAAQERAAEAAAREAEEAAQEAAEQAAEETQPVEQGTPETSEPTTDPEPAPEPQPAPEPEPAPEPAPEPEPEPAPSPPPPSGGAQAAIAFARAQIGEPYVWAAAGPDAWDCSGLTMAAWQRGGKYLPHYSVAQYEQSTPISPSSLRPGDLLFWGSSSSPGSIYHVALYVGGGQMIHAPRTGRPVTQESMYYWIPPNFYARP